MQNVLPAQLSAWCQAVSCRDVLLRYTHCHWALHNCCGCDQCYWHAASPRAPEIYEEQPYSFKSDVWALGCVMYEMLTGKPAFAADSLSRVVLRVRACALFMCVSACLY